MSPQVLARRKADARLARELRLFHAYRFLSTSYLFLPVMLTFFHARGLDYTEIALLNSVYAATAVLCEVPTGALADLFGRCRAMLLGALLMALGCVVDFYGHGFWDFAIGESLLALGMTLTSGADSAYLYDLLRSAGREDEYRRHEGAATAAKMLGAAVALAAGGFVGAKHPEWTYVASAGVCTGAALVAFMMREPAFDRDEDFGFVRGMGAAAKLVVRNRSLAFAVGFSILVFTLLRMGIYLHPAYLDKAGFSTATVGAILAGLSVLGAVGAQRIDAVRRRFGESRLVWLTPLALAASYLAMSGWFVAAGVSLLAVQALANGVFSPFSKELIQREVIDSGQRATVLSVESMGRRLAFGAFAPAAGVLMDRYGISGGFWLCGIAGLVGGLGLFLWSWARHRHGLHGFWGEVTPTPLPDVASAPLDSRESLAQSPPAS
jgi:predicted MFS family arabinose efflux permease